MKKEEIIQRYGAEEYERRVQLRQDWRRDHPEREKVFDQEKSRKGGKRYEQRRQHRMIGTPHEKDLVRHKHQNRWTPYKQIIAPEAQLHHEWLPKTSTYRGVALVEKNKHVHGFIDVIQILEGEITLLTEKEVREGGVK